MKFLRTASVFLFSSLFATGLAAPAPAAEVGSDLAISNIQKRCDGCDEIGNLVTVVKSFTAQISAYLRWLESRRLLTLFRHHRIGLRRHRDLQGSQEDHHRRNPGSLQEHHRGDSHHLQEDCRIRGRL
ncbi:hypothetical protein P152DRAFT_142759 [Eremomyces bilateralis CBS 781.70]|uniref:Uncharacterized protein n=1 Tax=Eremomyces bilateralis CBS 781.70 TaxID=1392243 RepID=A0A6G1FW19_9PEZI|nr:uncharacterized protein P152DRAFT_142759 [Eremomyces bilateralis CBS 781.70]KAF1809896.1 hypothetical protein P152DRAFT_142759 [Eremomyces bilateralis CBS 781.70]